MPHQFSEVQNLKEKPSPRAEMVVLGADQKVLKRFWSKVKITNDCWEWIGGKNSGGYGSFQFLGKHESAYKVSYLLFKGDVLKNLELDHKCRNHACVNPHHLRQITHRENILCGTGVAAIHSKKTHCKRGHLLKGFNCIERYKNGNLHRRCRTCIYIKNEEYRKGRILR